MEQNKDSDGLRKRQEENETLNKIQRTVGKQKTRAPSSFASVEHQKSADAEVRNVDGTRKESQVMR